MVGGLGVVGFGVGLGRVATYYNSKFGLMLKYKITQIMDDLSKPECVIYGENGIVI